MRINCILSAVAFLILQGRAANAVAVTFPSSLSSRSPPSQGAPDDGLTILHPGLHPDDDTADLNNLKAHKETSLYYVAAPGPRIQGAGILKLTHLYPAVSLERSRFISSITCNAASTSMTVNFKDIASFHTAFNDWSRHQSGFLLISYVAGCGLGVESSERSFHLISRITTSEKDLRIVCQIQTVPMHDTVHPDQEFNFHVATHLADEREPTPPNSHSRRDGVGKTLWKGFLKVVGGAKLEHFPFNNHESKEATFSTTSIKAYDGNFNGTPSYLLYHYPPKDSSKTPADKRSSDMQKQGVEKQGTNTMNDTDSEKQNSTTTESTKSLDIYCVGCGVEVKLLFVGNFVGKLGGDFTQADVKVEADVTATLVLGIHATYKFEGKTALEPGIEIPLGGAGIKIPKVLTAGFFAGFDVGVDYSLTLDGLISAGFICKWKGVGATLDLLKSRRSGLIGDWALAGHCEKVTSVDVKVELEIQPFVKLSIKVKLSILPQFTNKLTGEAALVEKVSVVLNAAVSNQQNGDCKALEPRIKGDLKSELYITITKLDDIKLHDPFVFSLFDLCIPLGISARDTSGSGLLAIDSAPVPYSHSVPSHRSDDGEEAMEAPGENTEGTSDAESTDKTDEDNTGASEETQLTAPVTVSTSIISLTSSDAMDWGSDGAVVIKSDDGSQDYQGWKSSKYRLTSQTSEGKTLYVTKDDTENGIGKLQFADAVPPNGMTVFLGQPPDVDYIAGFSPTTDDTDDIYIYLVECLCSDGTRPVFFTTDGDNGPNRLADSAIPGDNTVGCVFAKLSQVFDG
ncbi:hypothetical protein B0H10DRAFT_2211426 [Mycena sp. CBHHK59/15]|nr:hypothetical protein B0H10DRAFT_2211426 [Mycena sp. CBHHK59/15]